MNNTAKSRYQNLSSIREPVLSRARECATLTLPYICPPEGSSEGQLLPSPRQSVGAQGVISLTAKVVTTLFPPNTSNFRLDIEEFTLRELSDNPGLKTEVEAGLAMVERTTSLAMETSNIRVGAYEALLHLITTGNVLVFVDPNVGLKVFGLDRFVCLRDPSGRPIEIIAMEQVAYESLSEEIQTLLPDDKARKAKKGQISARTHTLYTHITRVNDKKWDICQWVDDTKIEATSGSYPTDLMPWLPLRWNRVDGESYGRSQVEAFLGDLIALEGLSTAILEFAAGAAKVIPLVNPNGMTLAEDLNAAENFEFVPGIATDVSFVRIEKYSDLQVAKQMVDDLTRRVAQNFLMGASIQRQGERVTAEEIRYLAGELEATIGGVYALLGYELQLPLAKIMMAHLTKQKRLPKLPAGVVNPTITTGLDALSRANDLNKLDRFAIGFRDLYGPEAMAQETNIGDYAKRRASALGLNIDGFVKTDEQKAAEAQARQQQEAMARLGPAAITQMGNMAKAGMEPTQ